MTNPDVRPCAARWLAGAWVLLLVLTAVAVVAGWIRLELALDVQRHLR